MPFTENKNRTWKGFCGSLNFRQIGLRHFSYFSFLPTFQFPRFLTMFQCSDLYEMLYAYSFHHYQNNFFLYIFNFWIGSRISLFLNSKYLEKASNLSVLTIFDHVAMLRSFWKLLCIFFESIDGYLFLFLFYFGFFSQILSFFNL